MIGGLELADNKGARGDQELAKALSHPIRVEILEALQGRVASAGELSQEMDQSLGVISYHAKTLVNCGCLELVQSKPARGSLEHFFGLALRSALGPQIPTASKGMAGATVEVDEVGWREIREIMEQASRSVAEAQARSAERLAGAKGVSIIVGLAAFEARKRPSPDEEER
jgi:DNA-binding transcriptional ArsR family regulator